jgi:Ni/Co efflux regulator RcnB
MLSPKFLAPALFFSAFAFSPAIAAPVAPPTDPVFSGTGPLIEVQGRFDDDDDDWRRRRDRDGRWRRDDDWRRRYAPGGRYRDAPRGWRRYGYRPRDWRRRGCILVGPIWFCP